MSFQVLNDLNWISVAVATLAYYLLALPWFAEFAFYPAWRRSIGLDAPGPLPKSYYIGPLITSLATVVALAMLAETTGSDTANEGFVLGLTVGVGVAAATLYNAGALDPTKPGPRVWFAVTGGYHLLGVVGSALIVSVWS